MGFAVMTYLRTYVLTLWTGVGYLLTYLLTYLLRTYLLSGRALATSLFLPYLLTHLFTHLLAYSLDGRWQLAGLHCSYLLTYLLAYSFAGLHCYYLLTYLLTYSLTYLLNHWQGFEQDHSVMKFTNGQHCWNGPSRSLTVSKQVVSK